MRIPDILQRLHRRYGQKFRRVVGFLLNGGVSFGSHLFWVWLFHEKFHVAEEGAVLISFCLLTLQNFLVLRYLVFRPTHPEPLLNTFLRYALSISVFYLIEFVLFLALHSWLHIEYLWVTAGLRILILGLKFLFYDTKVFLDRTPSAPR
jgi:putative flippase GtrA